MTMNRLPAANQLTEAQVNRLDRLEREEPATRVISWSVQGPVIRRENGKLAKVRTDGRLHPLVAITKETIGA